MQSMLKTEKSYGWRRHRHNTVFEESHNVHL